MQTSTLSATVVSHCFVPGSAECSQCMPVPTKPRKKARQSGGKKKKQKFEEVGSEGPSEHSQQLTTLRKQRQEASSEKTAIVKLLHHAIVELGEGCNTWLISGNSSILFFATLCPKAHSPSSSIETYLKVYHQPPQWVPV